MVTLLLTKHTCRAAATSTSKLPLQRIVRNVSVSFSTDVSRIQVHPEIKSALEAGMPVVALESTIITHGMPYPNNLETALEVENIVREEGCLPATIAILDGTIKVGLSPEDIERLAKAGTDAVKTSRRDLPIVLAKGLMGSTTVSATLFAAHQAGIKTFVTGGLGGVHRGAETTMDISSDLTELAKSPVTVVCAGVKAILDIPKTLEYLETQGVTVAAFGETNDFPAFYTRKSGFKAPFHFQTVEEVVSTMRAHHELGSSSGIVIAVPIPKSDEFKDPKLLNDSIREAVEEAKSKGIEGKDVTPFLLARLGRVTKGDSLKSNIALIKNNAKIGSRIAKQFAHHFNPYHGTSQSHADNQSVTSLYGRPLIIGASNMDITAKLGATDSKDDYKATSLPGTVHQAFGGVARNVAEASHRTGGFPQLWTVIGDDPAGEAMIDHFRVLKMDTTGIKILKSLRTATYNAFLHNDGELIGAVSDMDIHKNLGASQVTDLIEKHRPAIVMTDANPPTKSILHIAESCITAGVPFVFEPTSVVKSSKILHTGLSSFPKTLITPNIYEAKKLSETLKTMGTVSKFTLADIKTKEDEFGAITEHGLNCLHLLQSFPYVLMKMGSEGVLIGRSFESSSSSQRINEDDVLEIERDGKIFQMKWIKASIVDSIVSVTGAGDTMVGTVLTGLASEAHPLSETTLSDLELWAKSGIYAATLSLQSPLAVSDKLDSFVLSR